MLDGGFKFFLQFRKLHRLGNSTDPSIPLQLTLTVIGNNFSISRCFALNWLQQKSLLLLTVFDHFVGSQVILMPAKVQFVLEIVGEYG